MKEIYYWEREELTDPERILNHPLSTHRPDFKKLFYENVIHFVQMCNNQKGNFYPLLLSLMINFPPPDRNSDCSTHCESCSIGLSQTVA